MLTDSVGSSGIAFLSGATGILPTFLVYSFDEGPAYWNGYSNVLWPPQLRLIMLLMHAVSFSAPDIVDISPNRRLLRANYSTPSCDVEGDVASRVLSGAFVSLRL